MDIKGYRNKVNRLVSICTNQYLFTKLIYKLAKLVCTIVNQRFTSCIKLYSNNNCLLQLSNQLIVMQTKTYFRYKVFFRSFILDWKRVRCFSKKYDSKDFRVWITSGKLSQSLMLRKLWKKLFHSWTFHHLNIGKRTTLICISYMTQKIIFTPL